MKIQKSTWLVLSVSLGWCIFLILFVTWPLWSQAEEVVLGGESAMTFSPISEKARRLVEIELVSSAKYPSRYKRLELAVFRNDWRPLGFANDGQQPNPGKCIVTVLLDSYDIDCRMTYQGKKPDTLRIKVPDPDMVVAMVIHFSRKRME